MFKSLTQLFNLTVLVLSVFEKHIHRSFILKETCAKIIGHFLLHATLVERC